LHSRRAPPASAYVQVAEAAEILQEIAVETFGSMEKREKAEFLLEQVRGRLLRDVRVSSPVQAAISE
jgi:26S proteasome regulatory subunit N5